MVLLSKRLQAWNSDPYKSQQPLLFSKYKKFELQASLLDPKSLLVLYLK